VVVGHDQRAGGGEARERAHQRRDARQPVERGAGQDHCTRPVDARHRQLRAGRDQDRRVRVQLHVAAGA
jgi:hypothetical protein